MIGPPTVATVVSPFLSCSAASSSSVVSASARSSAVPSSSSVAVTTVPSLPDRFITTHSSGMIKIWNLSKISSYSATSQSLQSEGPSSSFLSTAPTTIASPDAAGSPALTSSFSPSFVPNPIAPVSSECFDLPELEFQLEAAPPPLLPSFLPFPSSSLMSTSSAVAVSTTTTAAAAAAFPVTGGIPTVAETGGGIGLPTITAGAPGAAAGVGGGAAAAVVGAGRGIPTTLPISIASARPISGPGGTQQGTKEHRVMCVSAVPNHPHLLITAGSDGKRKTAEHCFKLSSLSRFHCSFFWFSVFGLGLLRLIDLRLVPSSSSSSSSFSSLSSSSAAGSLSHLSSAPACLRAFAPAHSNCIRAMAMLADGQHVACASWDNTGLFVFAIFFLLMFFTSHSAFFWYLGLWNDL